MADPLCAVERHARRRPISKGVRVGTFDRSKGLEFRAVLIPRLGASIFPKTEDEQDDQLAIPHVADAPRELTEEEREARQSTSIVCT